MASTIKGLLETILPVAKTSTFKDSGRLTPDEFVVAGDFLTHKFPTWTWESSVHKVAYLPDDKQHLMTRNVPVIREILRTSANDWVIPVTGGDGEVQEAEDDSDDEFEKLFFDQPEIQSDAPEIDGEENFKSTAPANSDESASHEKSNTMAVRSYNLSITYDKYYQTPRMWLSGFDEAGLPLDAKSMYEDVSNTHLGKTITLETHPHEDGLWLTIHPCRHASVMKKLYASKPECIIDHYMVLFLKFMSSILYHIDYDNSMDF